MIALIRLLLNLFAAVVKPKSRLEAENAGLRHQLTVLQRRVRGRVQFTNSDRLFFIQLYRWFPSVLKVITIIRPETLVRWHRAAKLPNNIAALHQIIVSQAADMANERDARAAREAE